jgi:hypothetical protein
MDDRVIPEALERAVGPSRMAPVGARDVSPPVVRVAQIDGLRRAPEHHGRRREHLGLRARIVVGVRGLFRERHIAGIVDEAAELLVRNRVLVHPERADRDAMRGRLFQIVLVRAHQEFAARDLHHAPRRCPAVRARRA